MIVKNEEQFLKNALTSIKHLADEIIIVDTGSIDSTPEIALQFTPNLFNFKWNDNFASARNFALSKATGDWIFVLDADESVSVLDIDEFKTIIQEASEETSAYAFTRRNYTNEHKVASFISSASDPYPEAKMASGYIEDKVIRLVRNLPQIQFIGQIHATLNESVRKVGKIEESGIPIHHFGQLKFGNESKKEFYEHLYQVAEKESPSAKLFWQHGQDLLSRGDAVKAISYFCKSVNIDKGFFPAWLAMANGHLIHGDYFRTRVALSKARELNPNHFYIYLAQGIMLITERDFNGALEELFHALELEPKNAAIHYYTGLCLHAKGDTERAYLAFKNACDIDPTYKEKVKFE